MTPPGANVAGDRPETTQAPPAVSSCLHVLTKRADFLRAARARRQGTPGFTLQARQRAPGEAEGIRVGFTCSKKVGNAVARNRAKRRLREIARLVLPADGRPGWDYVLIGRPGITATRDFAEMQADLRRALAKVHGGDR
ncbi:ribonuclease P protein component [Rhodovulum marinum]|uniref:Ribonuclease P protein component n=1 Tax=Rhodovulum marinum TaxID=320662 RepID=A0A4R2PWS7_9RHOB|nr:ribonuclease P protein component [Rhodovulum marinum]TCP40447.1 ribonuclease P protein component [Rhodovulum marinum]